ncbi:NADH-quinone oxidoreductase subunit NuoF [bacterium]|nr:NADH-quinone oxidoreductase subunit NuoF [bacterium]
MKADVQAAIAAEKVRITLCCGNGCVASGAREVFAALSAELDKQGVPLKVDLLEEKEDGVHMSASGCQGLCQYGPILRVSPYNYMYFQVKPEDAEEIVRETVINGKVIERLLLKNPTTGESYTTREDIPFYKHQTNILLSDCGTLDSRDIREYIVRDGYKAAGEVIFSMTPEDVCREVLDSGLRGRGGAGFPTGRKWMLTQQVQSDKKYVVCNGDEGDPGAFMDGAVMEGNPHAILEGMLIAGYAIGADEGYIYVRAEYPLAIKSLRRAIEQAEEAGILGKHVMGSPFSFEIHIKEGAGAFVCGEETALIASIEGQRGMPRPKPPFPAQSGLWGKPTVINNVETYANVSKIILHGADWFRSYGVEKSPGTKTFSITGEVVNTGLIEVPLGTTIRQVVYDIGGGTRNPGRDFKAVQIGGPSGACLTRDHLDMPLDYDNLRAAGAMVGSGGLVILDEGTCMVEVARFFMHFTQSESCGKCVLCREGTKRMLELLEKIVHGEGTVEDIDLLQELAETVRDGSLCGLGKTAPNPVLSTLKYFKDEYMAHVVDKKCPAGQCTAFKTYKIVADKCKGCGLCAKKCPVGAISGEVKSPFVIDSEKCIKCGVCAQVCKFDAVTL